MDKKSKVVSAWLNEIVIKELPRVLHVGPQMGIELVSNGLVVKRGGTNYFIPNANVLAVSYTE